MKVLFIVDGKPKGKGRPRFSRMGGFVRTYTPKETLDYEDKIKMAYQKKYGKNAIFVDKPIRVTIDAHFKISQNTSKKKTLELEGKPYDKRPDVDNIGKVVLDALNGVAFHDDNQVTSIQINKWYARTNSTECVVVEIEEVV